MINSKKTYLIVALVVVLAGIVGFANTSFAQSIFKEILNSVRQNVPKPELTQQPASLYKPVAEYERAVIEAVKKASPAVVSITISKNVSIVENCPLRPYIDIPPELRDIFNLPQIEGKCETVNETRRVGSGSGFIVSSNGLILTNKHVVNDTKASYTVFMSDGRKFTAKVLARHPVQDLAVLKVEANDLPTVQLGDSSSVELGQTTIAIGNALGEYSNTVSTGVISGLSRTITASGGGITERLEGLLQTDAAINQGNSGGPLLNLKGEVIGINTAVSAEGQNIGFAIPINRAKNDLDSVKTSGEIQIPYIGVRYVLITPELQANEKLSIGSGALVRSTGNDPAVVPNSPAAKAGLRAGDIIISVNGEKIDKDHSLGDMIGKYKIGNKVSVRIWRDGKEETKEITLEKRPN